MAINKVNFGEFHLNTALTTTDTTVKITADNATYSLALQRAGGNLGAGRITLIDLEDVDKKEVISFSSVAADGTDSLSRNKYVLTIETADDAATLMRGLANDDDGTNSVNNVIAGNKSAFVRNSTARIAWDVAEMNLQDDLFESGTTVISKTAGETIAIREALSLHTDGKVYLYHNVNYPNFFGIADEAIASGAAGNVTTFGGLSTGHTGLTVGTLVYAENTGAVTQTPSATTKAIGNAESATSIRLTLIPDTVSTFTDDQFGVQNLADTTKTLDVDLSGNTTGVDTTLAFTGTVDQTITFPDGDITLATTAQIPTTTTGSIRNMVDGGATAGTIVYIDQAATYAQVDTISDLPFGKISASPVEQAFPVVGSGASMSSMKLALKKAGTPTDNARFRIETDSAGEPSGTLADANATGDVAGGGLSTSYADTTITFAGAFTLTAGTKYWVVHTRSGSQNNTNFFYAGAYKKHSIFAYKAFTSSWGASSINYTAYWSAAAGFETSVLAPTNAVAPATIISAINYLGPVETTVAFGAVTTVVVSALADVSAKQGALTPGASYYLSDTAGEISTTAGTITVPVGTAVDASYLQQRPTTNMFAVYTNINNLYIPRNAGDIVVNGTTAYVALDNTATSDWTTT